MSPPESSPPPLHELETLVMDEVWSQGPTTVRGVMDAINGRSSKDRAYTTYMTIMARLHRKGLLDREREGKTDHYFPRLSRDEYQQARAESEVATLVEQFGDVALVHFARELATLDRARQQKLRRLARRDA